MNALIHANEYQRLERRLDQIQSKLAKGGCSARPLTSSRTLNTEWHDVVRRLMQLDDLIAFDGDLVS